jgi:hypothetical protein
VLLQSKAVVVSNDSKVNVELAGENEEDERKQIIIRSAEINVPMSKSASCV